MRSKPRTMLHDIEARSEKIEETLTAAQGVGLQAQQMGVLMLQKAKSRAETIEANARVHAQIVKDETRRIHDEKIRLTEWADTLEKSAKKIAANTAHMVEIVVPKEPQPARIQVAPQMASVRRTRHNERVEHPALAHGDASTHQGGMTRDSVRPSSGCQRVTAQKVASSMSAIVAPSSMASTETLTN